MFLSRQEHQKLQVNLKLHLRGGGILPGDHRSLTRSEVTDSLQPTLPRAAPVKGGRPQTFSSLPLFAFTFYLFQSRWLLTVNKNVSLLRAAQQTKSHICSQEHVFFFFFSCFTPRKGWCILDGALATQLWLNENPVAITLLVPKKTPNYSWRAPAFFARNES